MHNGAEHLGHKGKATKFAQDVTRAKELLQARADDLISTLKITNPNVQFAIIDVITGEHGMNLFQQLKISASTRKPNADIISARDDLFEALNETLFSRGLDTYVRERVETVFSECVEGPLRGDTKTKQKIAPRPPVEPIAPIAAVEPTNPREPNKPRKPLPRSL